MKRIPVTLRLLAAGYCTHSEYLTIRGGSFRSSRFPAGFACIGHPELGPILFDTGYSERFYTETKRFPYSLYARVTPVFFRPEESAASQLLKLGIEADEVRHIVLSHFHADHLGGLRDFPNATFHYLQKAYDAVKLRKGFAAVRAAFLPGLLPADFELRSRPFDEKQTVRLPDGYPFARGLDVFGDGSIIAVDLPGHADGQIGLLVATESHDYLLCADAVWSSKAYRENRPPHPLAGLIMANRSEFRDSFRRLRLLHEKFPQVRIVPSHCTEPWTSYVKDGVAL
ncbi:MBL fold metallo-hydrolase [Paenibacillus contaminans]|uniref:MBL fold metallo-hydrolase n=1 Tax=Paenibacillus contaminans TaxID=450362 RepID=A0A329MIX3_9BACL|nr:MBL fold metallo-hydrolase [Paenibacillus contaminans]RAV19306.1 MBL fold metallo-hydrolase [Paenibacillus contaminans]